MSNFSSAQRALVGSLAGANLLVEPFYHREVTTQKTLDLPLELVSEIQKRTDSKTFVATMGVSKTWRGLPSPQDLKKRIVALGPCGALKLPDDRSSLRHMLILRLHTIDGTQALIKRREATLSSETGVQYTAASFSHNGRFVIAQFEQSGLIDLWDMQRESETLFPFRVDHKHRWLVRPEGSASGRYTVSNSSKERPLIWDMQSGCAVCVAEIGAYGECNFDVAFSPDDRFILAATRQTVPSIWDMHFRPPTFVSLRSDDFEGVSASAFSPDSRFIATYSSNSVKIWDLHENPPSAFVLSDRMDLGTSASFSRDGRFVVTASVNHAAQVWDLYKTPPTHVVLQHSGVVYSASFSPDGHYVATASSSYAVMLWNMRLNPPTCMGLEGHTGDVSSVSFSPDGNFILSVSCFDATVRIWATPKTDT